ncbi:uncharacterized protein BDV14DRAFT_209684 [Aspergillus stella-maris]|uniref:uncharacterized protein n=1 Tax=Aspergillus stella-maris TaxID=1810926 RepID=UPI003CCDC8EA
MPAMLDHLPLEILYMVVAYLRDDHRQNQKPDQPSWYSLSLQPLLSLCLVSKRLCATTQPILYHEFMPGVGDSWRSTLFSWDRRLTSFIRTVAQRRDLATCVRRVHLHSYLLKPFEVLRENQVYPDSAYSGCMPDIPAVPVTNKLQESEVEDMNEAIQVAGNALGIKKQTRNRLLASDMFTLLIAQLPYLHHCSIVAGGRPVQVVRAALLSAAGISNLPLKTVDLSLDAPASRIDLLSLHKTWRRSPLPTLKKLKNLRVTYSRLSREALKALLYCCEGLRSFTYEAGYRAYDGCHEPGDGTDHFRLVDAVEDLTRHSETLEYLHLDLRQRGHHPGGFDPRAVVTFRGFKVLKHLFLNLDEFHSRFWGASASSPGQMLVDLLPSSIEFLHLAGFIGDELPRLEKSLFGLAQACADGKVPALREVRWSRNEELHHESSIRAAFASAGVDFEHKHWPVTESTRGDDGSSPRPNFKDPFPLSDTEDPDL